jgi:hypothetical protein
VRVLRAAALTSLFGACSPLLWSRVAVRPRLMPEAVEPRDVGDPLGQRGLSLATGSHKVARQNQALALIVESGRGARSRIPLLTCPIPVATRSSRCALWALCLRTVTNPGCASIATAQECR